MNEQQPSMDSSIDWSHLPEHIIILIFRRISTISDLFHGALACKRWYSCFYHPKIWTSLELNIVRGLEDKVRLTVLEKFGSFAENLTIRVDQSDEENRSISLEALRKVAEIKPEKLVAFAFEFLGQNPLFYGGQEFVEALRNLFSELGDKENSSGLHHVDLHGLSVKFEDDLLFTLAANHSETLEVLDIQNQQLVCLITPECVQLLVSQCKNLKELKLFCCSVSNLTIRTLSEPGRKQLEYLSMYCSAQDKFMEDYDILDATWYEATKALPNLKVSLVIDHRCHAPRIQEIMQPSMPLWDFNLITARIPRAELQHLMQYYSASIRHVYLNTAISKKFQPFLVSFVQTFPFLETLQIQAPLDKEIIHQMIQIRPNLAQQGIFRIAAVNQPDELIPFIASSETNH